MMHKKATADLGKIPKMCSGFFLMARDVYKRQDHCSSHFNTASGGAPWTEGLSYVDLFHRSDRNDAFQLGTKMY